MLLGFWVTLIIHECGHMIVGTKLGFPVSRIWIGWPMVIKFKAFGIQFGFGIIPFIAGVYVDPAEFNARPAGRRLLMVLAGPLTSILVPIFAMLLYFTVIGELARFIDLMQMLASIAVRIPGDLATHLVATADRNLAQDSAGLTQAAVTVGIGQVFFFFVFLCSFVVGVVNLLPFPPLDGGRILLIACEKVVGKERAQKVANVLYLIGGLFLLALIAVNLISEVYWAIRLSLSGP